MKNMFKLHIIINKQFHIDGLVQDCNISSSAWNGRPWPGRSQNWMLMYFIINLSGSQQFSGSSIQNQVELSEWATGRFMHCLQCISNGDTAVLHYAIDISIPIL